MEQKTPAHGDIRPGCEIKHKDGRTCPGPNKYRADRSVWACVAHDKAYDKARRQTPERKAYIRAYQRDWAKDRYYQRKDQGLCAQCGKTAAEYLTMCWACVEYHETRYDKKVNTEGKIADILAELEALLTRRNA